MISLIIRRLVCMHIDHPLLVFGGWPHARSSEAPLEPSQSAEGYRTQKPCRSPVWCRITIGANIRSEYRRCAICVICTFQTAREKLDVRLTRVARPVWPLKIGINKRCYGSHLGVPQNMHFAAGASCD